MFYISQKASGRDYTATVALILIGIVVSPAVMLLSQPIGLLPIGFALAVTAVSLLGARLSWQRYSQLTIPTMTGAWSKDSR